MDHWDLIRHDVRAHHPEILLSHRGAARAILIELPQGERLQEHQVHEHAWLHVAGGLVEAQAGEDTIRMGPGVVAHFDAHERHEVRAVEDSRLFLLLAPWPGDGHPGARDA